MIAEALLHAAIIGFAAMVHGTIGIGFPMIATPLLAMTADVRTAILLLVLPTTLINLANILEYFMYKRANKKLKIYKERIEE